MTAVCTNALQALSARCLRYLQGHGQLHGLKLAMVIMGRHRRTTGLLGDANARLKICLNVLLISDIAARNTMSRCRECGKMLHCVTPRSAYIYLVNVNCRARNRQAFLPHRGGHMRNACAALFRKFTMTYQSLSWTATCLVSAKWARVPCQRCPSSSQAQSQWQQGIPICSNKTRGQFTTPTKSRYLILERGHVPRLGRSHCQMAKY